MSKLGRITSVFSNKYRGGEAYSRVFEKRKTSILRLKFIEVTFQIQGLGVIYPITNRCLI